MKDSDVKDSDVKDMIRCEGHDYVRLEERTE